MPVQVPSEPKKYTTIYDNFKGVDFTNDASNIYKRRSPTGLNMLPDLDGRPYKRTGWDIKFSAQDFANAAGVLGATVTPERTHYFSYGGHDFLMVFNSLGVFWIKDGEDEIHLAQLWSNGSASEFPPRETRDIDGTPTEVKLSADSNRAFFFEANGTAGFYVFVENTVYRFGETGGGYYFTKVEPKVPIILYGATPLSHVGKDGEALNMLTDRRTVEYFGDGTKNYTLPNAVESQDTTGVQILSTTSGKWVDVPPSGATVDGVTYTWTVSDNALTFNNAPPSAVVGNVRITYNPSTGTVYNLTTGVQTNKATITNETTEKYVRTRTVYTDYYYDPKKKKYIKGGSKTTTGNWWMSERRYGHGSATLQVPDLWRTNQFTLYSNRVNSGTFAPETNCTTEWGGYNSSLVVTFSDNAIADTGTSKTTDSGWSTISSTTTYQYIPGSKNKIVTGKSVKTVQQQIRTIKKTKTFQIYGEYTKASASNADVSLANSRDAFSQCRKLLNFGNNIYNQIFISSCTKNEYRNRVWYCAANDPSYFPDTNYMEVGSDDKEVMGLLKVGSYLGIVKKGSGVEASVYLAYPTTFEEETTYAVKQSVSGIGAISTGAFNILNEEPLFLSEHGIMGIDISEEDPNKQIRNRSFFINKRLTAEKHLDSAVSFVHNGLYYLAVNNHCYVLDGAQKSSWANEKTNLQYECYYLENIPAQCFAKMGDTLYFCDYKSNICYFKDKDDLVPYVDRYSDRAQWISANGPDEDGNYDIRLLSGTSGEEAFLLDSENNYLMDSESERFLVMSGLADVGQTLRWGDNFYTIMAFKKKEGTGEEECEEFIVEVAEGVPIKGEWSTIADDDEMVHFFKNLTKKGFVISTLPEPIAEIDVSLKPDHRDEISIGKLPVGESTLPYDVFVRKKVKKYKRLQIIIRNNNYNDGFALDQIVKTYTVGNYSKNRR